MDLIEQRKTAAEVRRDEGLPDDGRNALVDVSRLESLLREALAPEIPVYDATPFGDMRKPLTFSYTEGLGIFIVRPQNVQLGYRLLLMAGANSDSFVSGKAQALIDGLQDKWALEVPEGITYRSHVFFPPGENLHGIISHDNVNRAFSINSEWVVKPHPVCMDDFVDKAFVQKFGPGRVFHKNVSGQALLKEADVVGYTTASELGFVAMVLGKEAHDFTLFSHEAHGCYAALYNALRVSGKSPQEVLDRIISCPWSGYIPLDTSNEDARQRISAFIDAVRELHARYRPLTDLPGFDT